MPEHDGAKAFDLLQNHFFSSNLNEILLPCDHELMFHQFLNLVHDLVFY